MQNRKRNIRINTSAENSREALSREAADEAHETNLADRPKLPSTAHLGANFAGWFGRISSGCASPFHFSVLCSGNRACSFKMESAIYQYTTSTRRAPLPTCFFRRQIRASVQPWITSKADLVTSSFSRSDIESMTTTVGSARFKQRIRFRRQRWMIGKSLRF